MLRRIANIAGITLAALVLVIVAGALAFIPFGDGPAYRFAGSFGEPGDGPGQFNDPTGVAVTARRVFVADSRNGRIQVFDRRGTFERQFGEPGEKPGELGRPMNLTIADGKLYVPEYFNDRVQVFALDGTSRKTIGAPGTGDGRFNAPGGVGVLPGGDLLVADFHNHRVQRLTPEGDFVRQWGTTGETGTAAGTFTYPTDVAVTDDGGFVVADGYADRVQAFGADGAFRTKWGGPFAMNIHGPFNGWFATVTGVAIGPDGRVFVADFYNDRVQVFRPDGTFRTAFGETGDGEGQFNHAIALDVAADGTVYVADFRNDRVHVWTPK